MSHLASVLTVRWPKGQKRPEWAKALKDGEFGVFDRIEETAESVDGSLPSGDTNRDQALRGAGGTAQSSRTGLKDQEAVGERFPCYGTSNRDLL